MVSLTRFPGARKISLTARRRQKQHLAFRAKGVNSNRRELNAEAESLVST